MNIRGAPIFNNKIALDCNTAWMMKEKKKAKENGIRSAISPFASSGNEGG